MSLYNLLHGFNSTASVALAMLNIKTEDCGRFRDAWIEEGGKTICVFTRNGGGNREEYQSVIDELAKHQEYVEDFDDDFDCTYATIRFNVPNEFKVLAERLMPEAEDTF